MTCPRSDGGADLVEEDTNQVPASKVRASEGTMPGGRLSTNVDIVGRQRRQTAAPEAWGDGGDEEMKREVEGGVVAEELGWWGCVI